VAGTGIAGTLDGVILPSIACGGRHEPIVLGWTDQYAVR
jgi:hypothetical protein